MESTLNSESTVSSQPTLGSEVGDGSAEPASSQPTILDGSDVENGGDGSLSDIDLISPVIEWQGGGQSADEIHNQRTRTVSSCMQQRGWTYEPVIQQSPVREPRTAGQLREYRQVYGYGLTTQSESDQSSDPGFEAVERNSAYYSSLGVDEQRAYNQDLNGDISAEDETPIDGSCEAVAMEAMSVPLSDQAVMTELRNLFQAAVQSPEYLSAVDAWRTCLSGLGYEFSRDGDPIDLVMAEAGAGVPIEELAALEVEVALADLECALATTMPVLHRIETEIVQRLVEKYPEWGS